MNAAAIPDSVNILALSRWLHVRPEWLEYGRGEMKENAQGKANPEANIPPEEEWESVDALIVVHLFLRMRWRYRFARY